MVRQKLFKYVRLCLAVSINLSIMFSVSRLVKNAETSSETVKNVKFVRKDEIKDEIFKLLLEIKQLEPENTFFSLINDD